MSSISNVSLNNDAQCARECDDETGGDALLLVATDVGDDDDVRQRLATASVTEPLAGVAVRDVRVTGVRVFSPRLAIVQCAGGVALVLKARDGLLDAAAVARGGTDVRVGDCVDADGYAWGTPPELHPRRVCVRRHSADSIVDGEWHPLHLREERRRGSRHALRARSTNFADRGDVVFEAAAPDSAVFAPLASCCRQRGTRLPTDLARSRAATTAHRNSASSSVRQWRSSSQACAFCDREIGRCEQHAKVSSFVLLLLLLLLRALFHQQLSDAIFGCIRC